MVSFLPFRALRPVNEMTSAVAALPYDVMSREEASAMIAERPQSILRVTRPDALLDSHIEMDDPEAYRTARAELKRLIAEGILRLDEEDSFYIYAQQMGEHQQIGIVGLSSADDYWSDRIKKHEFTLPRKEEDRKRQVKSLGAHLGPVFLTHYPHQGVADILKSQSAREPDVVYLSPEGISHTLWRVKHPDEVSMLAKEFKEIDALYIADGHHRAAAAARVARERQQDIGADDQAAHFLTVAFASDELLVLPYQRVVKTLQGTASELLEQLRTRFIVTPCSVPDDRSPDQPVIFPPQQKCWGMYLGGQWYQLSMNETLADDVAQRPLTSQLDVSVLQDEVLRPFLAVEDPRTCTHIDFVGGIRGFRELERRANQYNGVAFTLAPTSLSELMAIADGGDVMPPKSTWFEPKLSSGLFANLFDRELLEG